MIRSRCAENGGNCRCAFHGSMVCPPHRGWSWSHHPRSRATRRVRKAKAAPRRIVKKRGLCSEKVRVRNQMGKESARPQALLYVVPKVCASAIWPFLYARWLFLVANFGELRQGEVRRIHLPRTWMNRLGGLRPSTSPPRRTVPHDPF
jgi:hypothetical protein